MAARTSLTRVHQTVGRLPVNWLLLLYPAALSVLFAVHLPLAIAGGIVGLLLIAGAVWWTHGIPAAVRRQVTAEAAFKPEWERELDTLLEELVVRPVLLAHDEVLRLEAAARTLYAGAWSPGVPARIQHEVYQEEQRRMEQAVQRRQAALTTAQACGYFPHGLADLPTAEARALLSARQGLDKRLQSRYGDTRPGNDRPLIDYR